MKHEALRSFTLPLLAGLVAAGAFLASCSHEPDNPESNKIPYIRITGGPPDSLPDSYTARIWWTGWDFDGIIDHYEYALDPPSAFTEEEVAHPEQHTVDKGGALQVRILLGPADDSDTLRYSKSDNAQTYTMDYVQTRDFSRIFAFPTPKADSVSVGSIRQPDHQFSGFHTIFVRCQDNDEAYSEVSHLAYTATTVTPQAEITSPKTGTGAPLTVGTQVEVRWGGTDADSPDPKKEPTAYLYKLVRLNALEPPVPILPTPSPSFVMYVRSKQIPWIEQSAESTSVRLFLQAGGNYMFALRAKDLAGAVEPFLDYSRGEKGGNVLLMSSYEQGGRPELCVTEPTLGTVCVRGTGAAPQRWDVPLGQKLFFEWTANADAYGGTIEGFNWGVDIPDIEREGPSSGWRGWTTTNGNFDPVVFRKIGIHVVYVRCRDTGGVQSIAAIVLNVVDFPLDYDLLIVDDYKDQTFPRDNQHDQFWVNLVANSGRFAEDDQKLDRLMFSSHGADDVFFQDPQSPTLDILGRYKMIFYDTHGAGYNGHCGLNDAGPKSKHLGAYLGAGGKLWISGQYTVGAMVPNVTGSSNLVYPVEIPTDSFPYEFMKIYAHEVRNDKNNDNKVNGMIGVRPFPNRPEALPAMDVDVLKQSPVLRNDYGVGACDVVFDPLFANSNSQFKGQIDSLYVFKTIGPTKTPPRSSSFEGKLVGIRWHDKDVARRHGRTMWFGFPMYYFKDAQAQVAFNGIVDWFREESPGAPAPNAPGKDFSGTGVDQ